LGLWGVRFAFLTPWYQLGGVGGVLIHPVSVAVFWVFFCVCLTPSLSCPVMITYFLPLLMELTPSGVAPSLRSRQLFVLLLVQFLGCASFLFFFTFWYVFIPSPLALVNYPHVLFTHDFRSPVLQGLISKSSSSFVRC